MNGKTKIICTIGPATESEENLKNLLQEGMDIMRLNFSHGSFSEHQARVDNFRKVGGTEIMQDLCGPKIRIGDFENSPIELIQGQEFTLTVDHMHGNEKIVHINYDKLPEEVEVGQHIFLFDGRRKLEVLKIEGKNIVCKVLVGGELKGRKGVNLPESNLSVGALTEKDKKDLEFGIENKVDYFALSFVRHGSDVEELRNILKEKNFNAKIISKIETPQAIENIDEIIEKSDGVMVARGDLAIEVPFEKVPFYQKEIIKKCNQAQKFVIVATQMLESMIHSSVPTRAETSDIANAVLDGADAVMLSEETTLGGYPIEAVKAMRKVSNEAETYLNNKLVQQVIATL